jgi:MFS family permease
MLYSISLGLSIVQFGILQAFYSISKIIFEVPSGIIADAVKRKYVLFFGSILASIASFGLFYCGLFYMENIFILLVVLFSLDSLAFSLLSGTDQALLYDYLKYINKENSFLKNLSNIQIISLLVLSASTILGGKMSIISFGITYIFQGFAFFVAGGVILFFSEIEHVKNYNYRVKSFKKILECITFIKSNKQLLLVIIFVVVFEIYINTLIIFSQGYFSKVGLEAELISSIIGIVTLLGVLGALLSRVIEKFTSIKFYMLITMFFLFGVILLNQHNFIPIIIGFLILNLIFDMSGIYAHTLINNLSDSSFRATLLSIVSFIIAIFSSLLYVVFGYIIEIVGYQTSFLLLGIISSTIFYFIYCFSRKLKLGNLRE